MMYERSFEFIRALGPERLTCSRYQGEIKWNSRAFNFKSYELTNYPPFDICSRFCRESSISLSLTKSLSI